MKCPQCEFENRPQAKFCEQCAAPLARSCASCGAQLFATAKFCPISDFIRSLLGAITSVGVVLLQDSKRNCLKVFGRNFHDFT